MLLLPLICVRWPWWQLKAISHVRRPISDSEIRELTTTQSAHKTGEMFTDNNEYSIAAM